MLDLPGTDCIGSAFNVKGIMQCPNCRKTEKGNWLYSNGRSYPDAGIDEWTYDEDLYDLNYSEMSYGVHWCPYSRLTHLHSSFEDRESPAIPYHDLVARHSFFSDHPAPPPPPPPLPPPPPPPSSSSHSCPYVAYFPLQPSPSSQPPSDSGADDAPVFYHPWGSLSGHSDIQSSGNFPTSDFYYRGHDPNPYSGPSNARPGVAEPPPPPVQAAARPTRLNSDRLLRPGPFLSPFLFGHGSPAMAATAAAITAAAAASSTPAGAYHGSSRMPTYQQRSSSGLGSMSLGLQRPIGGRSMPPPPPPHPADSSRFYMFSGGPSLSEMDSFGGGRFYAWERDRFSPFPLVQVERSSSWWGPFQWQSSENRSTHGRSNGGSHRSTQSS